MHSRVWLDAAEESSLEARAACIYVAGVRAWQDQVPWVDVLRAAELSGRTDARRAASCAALLGATVSEDQWSEAVAVLDDPFGSFPEGLLEHALTRMTFAAPWVAEAAFRRLAVEPFRMKQPLMRRVAALPPEQREEVVLRLDSEIGTVGAREAALTLMTPGSWGDEYSLRAIEFLAAALSDARAACRLRALEVVGQSPDLASRMVRRVLALWPDADARVRAAILWALRRGGVAEWDARDALREAQQDEDETVRLAAAQLAESLSTAAGDR